MSIIIGIYFIYEGEQLVYIGKSKNILRRLSNHSSKKIGRVYTYLEVHNLSDMAMLELLFIDKYKPVENLQDKFQSSNTMQIKLPSIINLPKFPMVTLKKTETKYMARIPQRELITAMKDLSSNAYKLLMYYYSRRDGWEFVEENIASVIGTSVRQLKKARKELVDKRYLLIQKGSVDVYFIGQGAVLKFLSPVVESEEDAEPMEPTISGRVT